jgi:crotonobetainyl-CoA:carnitine CoA-transferase CaiB-like acyl-CoA transferase
MFGFIGVLAALYERETTGEGQYIKSALYETTVFLMGQHMAYSALTGEPVPPMPARVSAWSIYRIFDTKDEPLFVGIISEKHWKGLCEVLGKDDWAKDERLDSNNKRIEQRDWLLPELETILKQFSRTELIEKCEARDIPVAPICKPEDLFDDPQLNKQKGGLIHTILPSGVKTKLPRMPIEMGGHDFGLRNDPPQLGSDTRTILQSLGYGEAEIDEMLSAKLAVASG